MNVFATRLQNAYFRANVAHIEAGKGRLRKGQFMQQAYPDGPYQLHPERYKTTKDAERAREASARRQFNKVIKGETSGVKIAKRGGRPQILDTVMSGKNKGQKIGGGLEGLWMVNVTAAYGDPSNERTTRSFIMQSAQYTTMEDVPYLYSILDGIVEAWLAGLDYPAYDPIAEIEPIRRSDVPGERRIDVDDLEIE